MDSNLLASKEDTIKLITFFPLIINLWREIVERYKTKKNITSRTMFSHLFNYDSGFIAGRIIRAIKIVVFKILVGLWDWSV